MVFYWGILNIQIYWKLILFIRVVMGLEREFNNNIIKYNITRVETS